MTRTPLQDRLDYLASLAPGWYDGEGPAISPEAIAIAREVLPKVFPDAYVYPMPEGGVQAENYFGRWSVTVEFHPGRVRLHACDLDGEDVVAMSGEDADWLGAALALVEAFSKSTKEQRDEAARAIAAAFKGNGTP